MKPFCRTRVGEERGGGTRSVACSSAETGLARGDAIRADREGLAFICPGPIVPPSG